MLVSLKRNVIIALLSLLMPSAWFAPARGEDVSARSDDGLWQTVQEPPPAQVAAEPWVRPNMFQAVFLDKQALLDALNEAPLESARPAQRARVRIALPMPDGSFAQFAVFEAPIMEPGLAAKFPTIKTYAGQGIDDPAASVRLDWTPMGFHAQVLSPRGAFYIDPFSKGDTSFYVSYHRGDARRGGEHFRCQTDLIDGNNAAPPPNVNLLESGETLRVYRLACAATGEYTAFHGGTVSAGMAAIVTAINRVTGIYEAELAVRFVLIEDNDLLVYTDPNADPYTNFDGIAMLFENQGNIDSVIGPANYDVGHVFSTGGGGVAFLAVTCTSGKARGVTGLPSPIGDAFYVDFVAHEMGHQFGGNHTFNGVNGSCSGGNRNGSRAYEPGSGSTIMAYAGICGPQDDLQQHSDPYFHSESHREIINWVTGFGGSCAVAMPTGNDPPVADAGPDLVIPVDTPFVLIGSASDPNDDPLTYGWEQRDLGPGQAARDAVDNGSGPLFRSFNPTLDPSRTLPRMSDIIGGEATIGEALPTTARTLNFRLTARDNRAGGGGVSSDDMRVTVDANRGPFRVTFPNEPVSLSGSHEVTWDVAGTDSGAIGATDVNILLSTNGGETFPIVLAGDTPNDGAEEIVLPVDQTSQARIKVESTDGVFFDISDVDFAMEGSSTPVLPADPHAMRKNRYVSFDPNNPSTVLAFRVRLLDQACSVTGKNCTDDNDCKWCVGGATDEQACTINADCDGRPCRDSGEACERQSSPVVLGWIGQPRDPSCQNLDTGEPLPGDPPCEGIDFISRVVVDPVFRVWDEAVVHLGDCEIAPARSYDIAATLEGVAFTSTLVVGTTPQPSGKFWADIVGTIFNGAWTKPNGIINVDDVTAWIMFVSNRTAPHVTIVDLDGERPNFIVNATDLQLILQGFRGEAYPPPAFLNQGGPAGCP